MHTQHSTRYQLFIQTRHPQEVSDFFHVFNTSNILNVVYWKEYFDMVRNVQGDIVECGIGRGRSLLTILALESLLRTFDGYTPRIIHALDSFEGFPEPTAEDASPRNPLQGEWSHSPNGHFKYSIANLHEIINKANISKSVHDELILIKGFFHKTAHQVTAQKIAILHLDSDLYTSVKIPLTMLADRVAPNGIIVLDDYLLDDPQENSEPFPGARRAVTEFLQDRSDFQLNTSIRGTPYLIKTA